MKIIELKDIGPIEQLTIPVPEGGGVSVLLGPIESGKSVGLLAVNRLADGKGDITRRDGSASGHITGLGASIKVVKSPRRTGQLESLDMNGQLAIDDLVDPGIDNPEAADAKRIKALVRISGVTADPALFYGLLGGQEEFERIVPTSAIETDDLVLMARKTKEAFESEARKHSDQAGHAERHAAGCQEACKDIDLETPHDDNELGLAWKAAVETQKRLQAERTTADNALRLAEASRKSIDSVKREYHGPDMAEAIKAVVGQGHLLDTFRANEAKMREAAAVAQQTYERAQQQSEDAEQLHGAAVISRDAALQHETTMAGWQESIDAVSKLPAPMPDKIAAATRAVMEAQTAVENGETVRRAIVKAEEAKEYAETAKTHRDTETRLRDAARATNDVLTEAVQSDALTVQDGRLVTVHPDRSAPVPYTERSDGMRTLIAITIAAKRIKKDHAEQTALVILGQRLWADLDQGSKVEVCQLACKLGINVITAATDNAPLHAEVFSPAEPEPATAD